MFVFAYPFEFPCPAPLSSFQTFSATLSPTKISRRGVQKSPHQSKPSPISVAMEPDDQEVIDAKQCRRHDHGVASSVLSARVKDEHEDPEHDEASLAGLPHGPSFRDVGDAWGKAVHLDDAAGAAEWDHDEAHAVGQAEIESR